MNARFLIGFQLSGPVSGHPLDAISLGNHPSAGFARCDQQDAHRPIGISGIGQGGNLAHYQSAPSALAIKCPSFMSAL